MGKYDHAEFRPGRKKRGPDTMNIPSGILVPLGPKYAGAVTPDPVRPDAKQGRLKLWSPELETTVEARTKEPPRIVQERAGGWTEVSKLRSGARPIPWREGSNLLKLRVVLWLDGWGNTIESVQPAIDGLRRLGYNRTAVSAEPVTLQVIGSAPYASGGVVEGHADSRVRWVVDSLEIVEHHWFGGAPVQATATLVLLEWIDFNAPPPEAGRRATKKNGRGNYTWRAADRLRTVVQRKYGFTAEADIQGAIKDVRKANPHIKRWSSVQAGDKITLPTLYDRVVGKTKSNAGGFLR